MAARTTTTKPPEAEPEESTNGATPPVEPEPLFTPWPEDKLMSAEISTRARLAVAMRLLKGVGKDSSGEGVAYKFRGIEDVSTAVHAAFAQVGVYTRVHEEVVERTTVPRGSKPWDRLVLGCTFTFCSPAADEVDGGYFLGEGLDNSDKVHQKALTGAYKDCMVKTFTIAADGEYEPERTTAPERDSQQANPFEVRGAYNDAGEELVKESTWQAILAASHQLTEGERKSLTEWRAEGDITMRTATLLEDDAQRVLAKIAELALKAPDATPEGAPDAQDTTAEAKGPDAAADLERPFTEE